MVRIPFEIQPGSGCPGGVMVNGKTPGLCITCNRLGGRELAPAVRLVMGEAQCVNFHGAESETPGAAAAPLGVPATHPQKVGRS